MKIAILTMNGCVNYGNLLQSYALQTVLGKMGHNVIILNRRDMPSLRLLWARCLSFFKCVYRIYVKREKNYSIHSPFDLDYCVWDNSGLVLFSDTYLNKTEPIFLSSSLKHFSNKHSVQCIVVGSDQVWRSLYTNKISDYFLGFLPIDSKIKKIAYAASFGTSIDPIFLKDIPLCVKLAHEFQAISVREVSAIQFMKKEFYLTPNLVLDPTLLLNRLDYLKLINQDDNEKGKGMLVTYILDKSIDKNQIIKDCCKTMELRRYELMELVSSKGKLRSHTVSEWLAYISNASFILTDSYHGCVFSILFHKPFIVIPNIERGNDRFESLLSLMNLKNRMVDSYASYVAKKHILYEPICFSKVEEKLETLITMSIDFLAKNCGNE